jgi:hypothetical protein
MGREMSAALTWGNTRLPIKECSTEGNFKGILRPVQRPSAQATVTDLARARGLSMSRPSATAV